MTGITIYSSCAFFFFFFSFNPGVNIVQYTVVVEKATREERRKEKL